MKYLIAIDSDGTLRNDKGIISFKTKKAIQKQMSKGNIVVICTARPRYYTSKVSKDAGTNDYLISSNGAEIYDVKKEKIVWATYLSSDSCKKLYDYAIHNNIRIMFVLENTEYVTQFVRNDNQILLTEDNFIDVLNGQVKQAMVISKEKDKINLFKSIVRNEYNMNILDSSKDTSEEAWFSVVSNEVSKGVAVIKLATYLDIDPDNIISIGNDNNDISMFKISKISVAVSNATKDAKDKATRITKSNNEDGVAIFLNELDNII